MILINHLYLLLAYAGMVIHTLTKMEEDKRKGIFISFKEWIKTNAISLVISIISIPILLILIDSDEIRPFLPLNNVTSVLVGWQTQSILKSLMAIAGKKIPSNENDTQNSSTPTNS